MLSAARSPSPYLSRLSLPELASWYRLQELAPQRAPVPRHAGPRNHLIYPSIPARSLSSLLYYRPFAILRRRSHPHSLMPLLALGASSSLSVSTSDSRPLVHALDPRLSTANRAVSFLRQHCSSSFLVAVPCSAVRLPNPHVTHYLSCGQANHSTRYAYIAHDIIAVQLHSRFPCYRRFLNPWPRLFPASYCSTRDCLSSLRISGLLARNTPTPRRMVH
ncbi:hypothetical protein P154DRAFT_552023 [Amniculicola lignicola CBS 123094]|uniref:Uncharacterized protein n=1 Tax=Amniculicola lignicola CBS 123094 TaxID=1392246 RepID=A0A6A5WRF5_9PLEO|nr:hypothetical protein P154DRAFT_552023 [Amniculicola lignicola CBS 123094]